jgi:hypothetical protein
MALPPDEYSIRVPGKPLSSSAELTRGYIDRVRAAGRAEFASPLSSNGIEIVLVFVDTGTRPDVDNVLKLAVDALKGIVYNDDKQVSSARAVAVPNDPALRAIGGVPHATFAHLLDGGKFLIRVRVPAEPSILRDLRTS